MPKENRIQLSVDDFLSQQEEVERAFFATVEPVATNAERLRLTPWNAAHGCLCHLAFQVPKASVAGLVHTGRRHACCGKVIPIMEVIFAASHEHVVDVVKDQLANASSERSGYPGDGPPPSDCQSECAFRHKQRMMYCWNHVSDEERERCFERAAAVFDSCREGCEQTDPVERSIGASPRFQRRSSR